MDWERSRVWGCSVWSLCLQNFSTSSFQPCSLKFAPTPIIKPCSNSLKISIPLTWSFVHSKDWNSISRENKRKTRTIDLHESSESLASLKMDFMASKVLHNTREGSKRTLLKPLLLLSPNSCSKPGKVSMDRTMRPERSTLELRSSSTSLKLSFYLPLALLLSITIGIMCSRKGITVLWHSFITRTHC